MSLDYGIFVFLKWLHIGFFMAWVGPALGAWLMLRLGARDVGAMSTGLARRLSWLFMRLLWIEHGALLGLVLSGIAMAAQQGLFHAPPRWFALKLLLLVIMILPLEALDIWFVHHYLPKVFKNDDTGLLFDRAMGRYHRVFTPIAVAVMLPGIAAVLWLAVAKLA